MFVLLCVYFDGSVEGDHGKYLKLEGGTRKNCLPSESAAKRCMIFFPY